MLSAGTLRHRVKIERPTYTQNATTGDMVVSWGELATLWASVVPLSGREFLAAAQEKSKVTARIVIRRRTDVDASMRIVHNNTVYMIEAVLPDADSGMEYQTMMVSEGVREV